MSIFPLPVYEADANAHHRAAMTDSERSEQLEVPGSLVVKFGFMKLIGEYTYEGERTPGCGTKLVARTHRGTEVVEMLTTTWENASCSRAVSREGLSAFIEHSGGKDFPFFTSGKILRVATVEDLNKQSALESGKAEYIRRCKGYVEELGLQMKLVEVEPILGGELLTFYYMAEERVDFRELVRKLAAEFKTRIEMRQVGARDEARLVADYERCGQYCCCKGFLKVLRPVSMKSAKLQKATLDPLKISGRCGRLMCCLRYEDETYRELQGRLPRKGARVGTGEGAGTVLEGKVLVQLVLVRLEHDGREVAVPVEELLDPEACPRPGDEGFEREVVTADPLRGMPAERVVAKAEEGKGPAERRRKRGGRRRNRRRKVKEAGGGGAKAPGKVGEESVSQVSESGKSGGGRARRRRGRGRGRRRSPKQGPREGAGGSGGEAK